jgi:predicted phosphodiesterase
MKKTKTRPQEPCIAVISDIHGNLEALQCVLRDAIDAGAQEVLCLGDVVGYGPEPMECIGLLQEVGAFVLMGNHDAEACMPGACNMKAQARKALDWTVERLTPETLEWMKKRPMQLLSDDFEAVHASLVRPFDWFYVTTALVARYHFQCQQRALCFCGHTHVPTIWEQQGGEVEEILCPIPGVTKLRTGVKWLVNTGSVGQSRDGDNRACYVIYRPTQKTIEFRRVKYDLKNVIRLIRQVGLPRRLGERLQEGT